jgi:hypothetical protein
MRLRNLVCICLCIFLHMAMLAKSLRYSSAFHSYFRIRSNGLAKIGSNLFSSTADLAEGTDIVTVDSNLRGKIVDRKKGWYTCLLIDSDGSEKVRITIEIYLMNRSDLTLLQTVKLRSNKFRVENVETPRKVPATKIPPSTAQVMEIRRAFSIFELILSTH